MSFLMRTFEIGEVRGSRRKSCRRAILLAIAFVISVVGAEAQSQLIQVGNLRVELERIVNRPPADQLAFSVFMDTPNDSSGRMFFAEQAGRVQLFHNGAFSTALDLSGETLGTGERGLLGFTFHPGFADVNSPGYQKLYTYHSAAIDATKPVDFAGPGTISHHNLLTEWQMDAGNSNVVDVTTRREIFREAHVSTIHNGGMLDWGPDGYLYGSIGTPPAGAAQQLTAQDNTNLFGTMFRIDPIDPILTPTSSNPISVNGKYRIAAGNPFLDDPTALDEIFAYGLRSPYRFSVDPLTGLVFMGDVGQGAREEVDVVPIGGNMGWPYREGTIPGTQPTPNPAPALIPPIAEYSHADGQSIIGGYVYRGSIPELQGKYIFGELSFGTGPRFANQGRLFWIDPFDDEGNVKDISQTRIQEIEVGPATCANSYNSAGDCSFDAVVVSFAIDDDGELYVLGFRSGRVVAYKFVSAYFLPEGDYNQDSVVDAADYTLWRDTFGSTTDLRANGDDTGASFGVIDDADFEVWKAHFGETLAGAGEGVLSVPEPTCTGLALLAMGMCLVGRHVGSRDLRRNLYSRF